MDIQVQCMGCGQVLQVDRGFAGGVCRCPYCKELQSVPEMAAGGSQPSGAARPVRPQKPALPAAGEVGSRDDPLAMLGSQGRVAGRRQYAVPPRDGRQTSSGPASTVFAALIIIIIAMVALLALLASVLAFR